MDRTANYKPKGKFKIGGRGITMRTYFYKVFMSQPVIFQPKNFNIHALTLLISDFLLSSIEIKYDLQKAG